MSWSEHLPQIIEFTTFTFLEGWHCVFWFVFALPCIDILRPLVQVGSPPTNLRTAVHAHTQKHVSFKPYIKP